MTSYCNYGKKIRGHALANSDVSLNNSGFYFDPNKGYNINNAH